MLDKIKWILHCIQVPREYFNDDKGRLMVREWFNKPVELMEHLRRDHHLCQAEINEIILAVRKLVKGGKVKVPSHSGDLRFPDEWV